MPSNVKHWGQRAQHFTVALTDEVTDASSITWREVVHATAGPFHAGVVFPTDGWTTY